MPLDPAVAAWVASRTQAVLVTLRADGSPQTSNVLYDGTGGVVRVSVTAGRAKTHNLRRDPRAVLHVLGETFWEYAAVRVTAGLGAVTTEPGDAAGRELLELYERLSGPHPDPQEFFAAMVAEQRLVLRLVPVDAVAQGV